MAVAERSWKPREMNSLDMTHVCVDNVGSTTVAAAAREGPGINVALTFETYTPFIRATHGVSSNKHRSWRQPAV